MRYPPDDIYDDEYFHRLRWMPYVLFGLLTAVIGYYLLRESGNWGWYDWDLFTAFNAAAVKSISEFNQFPFWNPYFACGGILFAHPEASVLNPLFFLSLVAGPLIGLKLQLLVIYYLGFIGSYKLARNLNISFYGSLIVPVIFMLSSFFALQIASGHIWSQYFCALPWLFLFYRKSLDNQVHIFSAAAVVAFLILGSGAAVPLLMSMFFLFLYSLFDIGSVHRARPPLLVISISLIGVLFAAVKFLPMVDYLIRNPWHPATTIQQTPTPVLTSMFFGFHQGITSDLLEPFVGNDMVVWGWHEYGAFIGPIAVMLAVIGIGFRFKSQYRWLALSGIGFLLLLGSFAGSFSPWNWLHHLPGFESMRVPSRFSLWVVFSVSILAGYGIDIPLMMLKYRRASLTTVVFLALVATHFYVSVPIYKETFIRPPKTPPTHFSFKQSVGGSYNSRMNEETEQNLLYFSLLSNRGAMNAAWLSAYPDMSKNQVGDYLRTLTPQAEAWYDPEETPRVEKRDYKRERIVFEPWYVARGSAQIIKGEFSPNRIALDVSVPQKSKIIITQMYDPGWRATVGEGEELPVSATYDLVSIEVEPGTRKIELTYRPPYFYVGLLISVLSIIGAVGLVIILRRRQSVSGEA